ncbi:hypothetical protein BDQ12DRAFT_615764, partial [Crucibulum laeve]
GCKVLPPCAQIKIVGHGIGARKQIEIVAFPGGYNDNDKDIFDPVVHCAFPPFPSLC